jgi:glycerophosphoryl diester phosphodiesterase
MRKIITAALTGAALAAVSMAATAHGAAAHEATRPAPYAGQASLGHCPVIYAHKGAEDQRPANTVDAFRRATALGVDSELDVIGTRDLWPVVIHGGNLAITTNGSGLVQDRLRSYVETLYATNYAPWKHSKFWQDKVPGLYQALAAVGPHRAVFMDVGYADSAHMQRVYDAIASLHMLSRVVITTRAPDIMAIHKLYPLLHTALLQWTVPAPALARASAHGDHIVAVALELLRRQLVASYHAAGLQVYSWTTDVPRTDNEVSWRETAAWGVDYLATGHPAAMKAWESANCA